MVNVQVKKTQVDADHCVVCHQLVEEVKWVVIYRAYNNRADMLCQDCYLLMTDASAWVFMEERRFAAARSWVQNGREGLSEKAQKGRAYKSDQ